MSESKLLKRFGLYAAVLLAVALVTWIYCQVRMQVNATTIGLTYLLIVLVTSISLDVGSGIVASVTAALCFNYFFLPPFGTFAIEDPQNWVAFGTFLIVAVVVSRLSAAVKSRALQAEHQRDRAGRLYRLCRNVIATPDAEINISSIAKMVVDTFGVEYCSLHVPDEMGHWQHATLVSEELDPRDLGIPDLQESLRNGTLQPSTVDSLVQEQALGLRYSVIAIGGRPIGVLALKSRALDKEAVDSIAGVVGLALERVRYLAAALPG